MDKLIIIFSATNLEYIIPNYTSAFITSIQS